MAHSENLRSLRPSASPLATESPMSTKQPGGAIRREAARIRRIDQRWLFRTQQRSAKIRRKRRHSFELDCLVKLGSRLQLTAYHHHGFWQAMDTPAGRPIKNLTSLNRAGSIGTLDRTSAMFVTQTKLQAVFNETQPELV